MSMQTAEAIVRRAVGLSVCPTFAQRPGEPAWWFAWVGELVPEQYTLGALCLWERPAHADERAEIRARFPERCA